MKLSAYLIERGSQKRLADALKIDPSLLSLWATGNREVPVARCVEIERATAGKVGRRDLRKDWMSIWPELDRRIAKQTT